MPEHKGMKRQLRSRAHIRQLMGNTGQRVTPQRALLLDLLRQKGGHMDADELYRLAREKQPRISLSTVYRSLRLFKQLGLVEELHLKEDHHHYEGKLQEHFHLVCLRCGRIVEFASPLIDKLKQKMAREKSFDIQGAEVHLTGLCPRCRGQEG